MPSNYTAVTIGPIYKTMSQARKTRHLWGASYLFSYIMKQLINKLLYSKLVSEDDILLPHSTVVLRSGKEFHGTGLLPDRLFLQHTDPLKITQKLNEIQNEIIAIISGKTGNQYDNYFKSYFRIYFVNYSLPDNNINLFAGAEKNSNIVLVGNKLLDSLELKEKYYHDISDVSWQKIIDDLNGKGLLYKDAFGNVKEDYQFPFLVEIATDDFRQRDRDGKYEALVKEFLKDETEADQQIFLDALKAETKKADNSFYNLQLRSYHKYIAVVQADGDNIGATIAKIGNSPKRIQQFSKALGEFAIAATQTVKNYGGKPVYIGGDDLLFFAPVAVNNNENSVDTIFGLIGQLDNDFKTILIDNDALKDIYQEKDSKGKFVVPKPSLSYGVSITFTKYPLNEAKDSAYELMKEAKSIKDDKNKICFKLLKHSGQGLGFTIDKKMASGDLKNPRSFDTFLKITSRIPLEKNLLSSIIYKLHPIRDLLNKVAGDQERLEALFANTFNEPIHDKPEVKDYLTRVAVFIHQLYVDFKTDIEALPDFETQQRKSNLQKIYSTLRFVKFVTDEINE